MMSMKNPLVYLDVSIDGAPAERLVFELFSNLVPKTAENFRALCTGEKGNSEKTGIPLHYKGSFFHSIIEGYMFQGGDIFKRDGSHGESIYGDEFPDESSKLKHDRAGLLTMAVADRDSRGSLFSVTFSSSLYLDRVNVVFGKLVRGLRLLRKIEILDARYKRPSVTVEICDCGEISESEKQSSVWGMNIIEGDKKAASQSLGKDVTLEGHSLTSDNGDGSESEHEAEDNGDARTLNRKHIKLAKNSDGNQTLSAEGEDGTVYHKVGDAYDAHEREEGEYPKENGDQPSDGVNFVKASERPDVVDNNPHITRYRARRRRSLSPICGLVCYCHHYSCSRSPVETSRYRPSCPVKSRRAPRSGTPPSQSRSLYERRFSNSPSLSRTSKSKSKSWLCFF